jgi:hypothetical protein
VGVVKPGFCTAGVSASRAARAVETVETLGGAVASLSMDEPLAASDACGLDLAATAEETAAFVRRLRGSRPSVVVGDIEPYPLFDVATLGIWLDALAARDARPDFFHLDVDRATAARRGIDVAAGLKGVRALCAERSLPFGVLLYGGDGVDDAGYFAAVLSWTDEVAAAVGMPDHVVFQSFSMSSAGLFDVPRNLPEGDPKVFSHTRLVLDGLAEFGRTGHALR